MFNKTALYIAVEKGNIEIIKDLLNREEIDVNAKSIPNFEFFIQL